MASLPWSVSANQRRTMALFSSGDMPLLLCAAMRGAGLQLGRHARGAARRPAALRSVGRRGVVRGEEIMPEADRLAIEEPTYPRYVFAPSAAMRRSQIRRRRTASAAASVRFSTP